MNVQRTIRLYPSSKAKTSRILPFFTNAAASAFTNSLISVGIRIIL